MCQLPDNAGFPGLVRNSPIPQPNVQFPAFLRSLKTLGRSNPQTTPSFSDDVKFIQSESDYTFLGSSCHVRWGQRAACRSRSITCDRKSVAVTDRNEVRADHCCPAVSSAGILNFRPLNPRPLNPEFSSLTDRSHHRHHRPGRFLSHRTASGERLRSPRPRPAVQHLGATET